MGRLIYSALVSLDGYLDDANGDFSWAAPDSEVHAFVNDLERPVGTYLYGRRMYEVLSVWETFGTEPDASPETRDYGQIWRAADKVVYSTRLDAVHTARTRLERTFDPEAVRALVEESDSDVSIGGAGVAGQAIRAGLVSEIQVFHAPAIVGGGTAYLPDVRLELRLLDERRFRGGFVYARYEVSG